MEIAVNYIDTSGNVSNKTYPLSLLGFCKHMAIAGQGYAPRPQKLFRTLGMFFHYSYYLQAHQFRIDKFSEPPIGLSDPTEKAQFSNLAGKAIADFLSKRIDKSLYTVNYEAVMRINNRKLKGSRPDLIAYSPTAMIAIEAKGRSDSNPGSMAKHKRQAKSGTEKVNFSVACVSYNLFDKVKCNYHDPFDDTIPYDNEALRALTMEYYSGLAEFLNQKMFSFQLIEIQGEKFYKVELFSRSHRKIFPFNYLSYPFIFHEFYEFYNPCLILPGEIMDLAKNGISRETPPFVFEANDNSNLYIDYDRVGLSVRY